MNLKPFRPTQNLDNRDQHSEATHQMWIALVSILAMVLAIVVVLTLIGAGGADAALLDR